MTGRLSGKVAIVAGAGSIGPGWGNGKATATIFAREGARVVCADINRDAAEETAGIIRNEGGEAFALQADVTKAEQVAGISGRHQPGGPGCDQGGYFFEGGAFGQRGGQAEAAG